MSLELAQAPQAYPKLALGAVVCLALLSVILVASQTAPSPNWVLGLLIIWLSALPGLLHLLARAQTPAPIFAVAGLYYLIFFGLPVFLAPLNYHVGERMVMYRRVLLDQPGSDVLMLVAAGIAMLVAGYYATWPIAHRFLPRFHLGRDIDPSVLRVLYWILIAASFAFRCLPFLQSLPSVGQFFDPVGYLALGGFYLLWRAGCLSRGETLIILCVVLPLEIYLRIRILFITDILFLLLFVFFVLVRARAGKFMAVTAAIGVFVVLSYGATAIARNAPEAGNEKLVLAVKQLFLNFSESSHQEEVILDNQISTFDLRYSRIVHRIGHLWLFQWVYQQSPDPVPYWAGETYRPLLTAPIPRAIYPDKPEERTGGKFGYRYGFLPTQNEPTSVNVPWMIELLANFGPKGVIAGMAVFGIILAAVVRVFCAWGMSDVEFLIGLTVIFRLPYQESNFSVMTGSLPLLVVSLWLYFSFGSRLLERFIRHSPATG